MTRIPVSVLVLTLNEERRLGGCLAALTDFDDVIIIDSHSSDRTAEIARQTGARVWEFSWDGRYPKKKQTALDRAPARHPWVLLLDADEIMTPALVDEIRALFVAGDPPDDGYFIRGLNTVGRRVLRYGAANKKLSLLHRGAFAFPVVNDLDLPGMGEVEGHYQPAPLHPGARIGTLAAPLVHESFSDMRAWEAKHTRYAAWEAAMNARNAWPADPVPERALLKKIFRALPFRPLIAFAHSYIVCQGFRDGRAGWVFAAARYRYYKKIRAFEKSGTYWL